MSFDGERFVCIWVGRFLEEEELSAYVEAVCDEDGDSHCPFWSHSGVDWFDHDFQEANFLGKPPDDWHQALAKHSYADSFASRAAAALKSLAAAEDNALVLLYDCDYDPAGAPPSKASLLQYVGRFPYRKDDALP
jgi:hypothetical protein